MNIVIYIDGGSRGNPGPAAAGVVITDADDGTPLCEAGYFLGKQTNNYAEYQGLIRAVDVAAAMKPTGVRIMSDSQLMVRQINGQYKVKSAVLKPLYAQAVSKLKQLSDWSIEHVYRDKNKRADELVNMAIDAKRDVVIESPTGFATSQQSKAAAQSPHTVPTLRCRLTISDPSPPMCPARMTAGQTFDFGPTTPDGLCVHAAVVVLRQPVAAHGTVTCTQCGLAISMRPPAGDD